MVDYILLDDVPKEILQKVFDDFPESGDLSYGKYLEFDEEEMYISLDVDDWENDSVTACGTELSAQEAKLLREILATKCCGGL